MSLNDPQWGRKAVESDDKNADQDQPSHNPQNNPDDKETQEDQGKNASRGNPRDPQQDLDKLWDDFNRALNGIFGNARGPRRSGGKEKLKSRDDFDLDEDPREDAPTSSKKDFKDFKDFFNKEKTTTPPSQEDNQEPPFMNKNFQKGGRIGMGFLVALLGLAWGATGFYIVPEGQSGVVTTFGRYTEMKAPGFRWHLPYPVQSAELVDVSSVRTTEIGIIGRSNRLSEALMLTDDENIVDVMFNVQYRIQPGIGAKDYLYNTRSPDISVTQVAESAMREVVGRKTMDSVLFESKQEITEAVRKSMQEMLDRYGSGIEVMSVAIQNAQPPQPVQAAFDDAVKAGQDRERQINEGEAYSNAVIPRAKGTASELLEQAHGYKAKVVESARGDADRFNSIYREYAKAPKVTRDRLYIDTMRDIYSNVSKVYVDNKAGNNLLYLPLDRIIQDTQQSVSQDLGNSNESKPSTTNVLKNKTIPARPSSNANGFGERTVRTR